MLFTLYLIGYGNEVPAQLFERLEMAGERVLVIDVRSRRRSWAWSYSAPQVEYVFKTAGHDYIWLPALGSYALKRRTTNLTYGLRALEIQVRKQGLPVVLLCAERLSTHCHRAEIAKLLQQRLEEDGDHLEIRPL